MLSQPHPFRLTTARDAIAESFGSGIYRYDTLSSGAGNRGTDAVRLFIGIPLLVLGLTGRRRRSLRWPLIEIGALTWFLYVYATMAVGAAFNPLFVVYVAVFLAGLWALVVAVGDLNRAGVAVRPDLPRRGPAVLMVVSGVVTALIWPAPAVSAQLAGQVPARLDDYTTLVTAAIDSAVITPAAIAAGVLIWRAEILGYLLAIPLLILESMLAPATIAQTVSQLSAGVRLQPAEIAGPVLGFLLLSGCAVWALIAVLRPIGTPWPAVDSRKG